MAKVTGPSIKARLEKELPREPRQVVIAKHVHNNCYRVNWYIPLSFIGNESAHQDEGQIVRSKFMSATEGPDGSLVVKDRTRA